MVSITELAEPSWHSAETSRLPEKKLQVDNQHGFELKTVVIYNSAKFHLLPALVVPVVDVLNT